MIAYLYFVFIIFIQMSSVINYDFSIINYFVTIQATPITNFTKIDTNAFAFL